MRPDEAIRRSPGRPAEFVYDRRHPAVFCLDGLKAREGEHLDERGSGQAMRMGSQ